MSTVTFSKKELDKYLGKSDYPLIMYLTIPPKMGSIDSDQSKSGEWDN